MTHFLTWKTHTIIVAGILGAVYGFVSVNAVNASSESLQGMAIAVIVGAALCASAGSTICRVIETAQRIRESQKRPTDNMLCYRGTCYDTYDLVLSDTVLNDGGTEFRLEPANDRKTVSTL